MIPAASTLPGCEDLLDEERVAAGAACDALGLLDRRAVSEDRRRLRADCVDIEGFEVDPVDSSAPGHIAEDPVRGFVRPGFVRSLRHHDHERGAADRARDE